MPVTRESVEAAKQARDREREMVYRATGVKITDDGRIDTRCRTCDGSGFVAYWDGSAYAGEGCPDCPCGPDDGRIVLGAQS